jgi:hypothetical protein
MHDLAKTNPAARAAKATWRNKPAGARREDDLAKQTHLPRCRNDLAKQTHPSVRLGA